MLDIEKAKREAFPPLIVGVDPSDFKHLRFAPGQIITLPKRATVLRRCQYCGGINFKYNRCDSCGATVNA